MAMRTKKSTHSIAIAAPVRVGQENTVENRVTLVYALLVIQAIRPFRGA